MRLDHTVTVPADHVLTIEAGTVILMKANVGITVHGQLMANGTDSQPIHFTHYGDGTTWERIMFVDAEDSRLSHCTIEYADCKGDHKDYNELLTNQGLREVPLSRYHGTGDFYRPVSAMYSGSKGDRL